MRKMVLHFACVILVTLVFLGISFPAAASVAYIPHITGGFDGWLDYLQVDNTGITNASFDLTLYADGVVVYGPQSHTVSGLSEATPLNLKELAATAAWGKIEYTSPSLVFRACYEYEGGPAAEFALNDSLNGILGFFFSTFSANVISKGIAITNIGDIPAVATLVALGGGSVLGNAQVTINPRTRILGVHTTWFPSVNLGDIQKVIMVSSSTDLCGITIQGMKLGPGSDASLAHLLFTQAMPVSEFSVGSGDFSGTWDGTWRSLEYFGVDGEVTMYLVQTGDTFSGTADLTNTDAGDVTDVPITGTISGNTITLQGTYVYMGHTATLDFTQGVIAGNTIKGVYTQLVDGEHYDAGTFSLTKVQ